MVIVIIGNIRTVCVVRTDQFATVRVVGVAGKGRGAIPNRNRRSLPVVIVGKMIRGGCRNNTD